MEAELFKDLPRVQHFGGRGSLIKALLQGRIDIAVDSVLPLLYNAKTLGVDNQIEAVYTLAELPVLSVWSSAALGERIPWITVDFNQALQRLKARGEIAEIIKRYGKLEHFNNYGPPLNS